MKFCGGISNIDFTSFGGEVQDVFSQHGGGFIKEKESGSHEDGNPGFYRMPGLVSTMV